MGAKKKLLLRENESSVSGKVNIKIFFINPNPSDLIIIINSK